MERGDGSGSQEASMLEPRTAPSLRGTAHSNGRTVTANGIAGPRRLEARWEEEAAFFDRQAARVDESTLPIDPLALRRYARPSPRRRFNKEFRFRLLGRLEGRSLLDVGCGDGLNVAMFAKMGASVTGIDVSRGASRDSGAGASVLVRSELDLVRRYIPDLRMRHYMFLGRLDRFILVKFNYERSAAIRRAMVSAIGLIDYALLSLPLIQRLAGTCVMYGRPIARRKNA